MRFLFRYFNNYFKSWIPPLTLHNSLKYKIFNRCIPSRTTFISKPIQKSVVVIKRPMAIISKELYNFAKALCIYLVLYFASIILYPSSYGQVPVQSWGSEYKIYLPFFMCLIDLPWKRMHALENANYLIG